MQNKIKKISIILIFGFVFFLPGCEKNSTAPDILKLDFIDTVNVSTITYPQDAIEKIRYNYENTLFRWGLYNSVTGVLSGEYTSTSMELSILSDFNNINPASYQVSYFWDGCYNSIILSEEYINTAKNKPDEIAAQDEYLGQVYFYQALAYLTTVRIFGKFYPNMDFDALGIPIFSLDNSLSFKRNTIQENYNLIIADLEKAATLLPEKNSVIPTKYSAKALAAQAHMWFNNYDDAAILLESIFQSENYTLVDNYAYLFDGKHENSSESIFEMQYYENGSSYYYKDMPPAQNYGVIIATSYDNRDLQFSDFAVAQLGNDPRVSETYYGADETMYDTYGNTIINSGDYPNLKKYLNIPNISISESGVNICFIRLAELYLMYAEIQIQKGNNLEAAKYINMVRKRAGVPEISSPDMNDLMHEKFVELCGEGVYWFDIIRWDKAQELLGNRHFSRGVNEVLPINESVINAFPAILQNPGY